MGLAVGVPRYAQLCRADVGRAPPPSHPRDGAAASREEGGVEVRHLEASELPHISALVRHALARIRIRRAHDPKAAGASGFADHDGLHARAPARPARGGESARSPESSPQITPKM